MRKLITLALLILMALPLFGLNFLRRQGREAATFTEEFFHLASSGQKETAAGLLELPTGGADALLEVLGEGGAVRLSGVSEVAILSPFRLRVTVNLDINGTAHSAAVNLKRRSKSLRITSFPSLELLQSAYVLRNSENEISLLDESGRELTLAIDKTVPSPGNVGMAVGIDGVLAYFKPFTPVSLEKLLTITDSVVEGEKQGFIHLANNTAVFRGSEGTVRAASSGEMTVGMQNVRLYLENGEARAVLLPDSFTPDRIRVALNTSGFGGTAHRAARVSSAGALLLEDRVAGHSYNIAAGEPLELLPRGDSITVRFPSGKQEEFSNRLFVSAKDKQIRVETLRRGNPEFVPQYRGHLEFLARAGSLNIINDVALDDYLLSVVPSEMPVSFGTEPLKAQAVAARTYAVSSMTSGGMRHLAAHVDDSTMSQVYNNVPEFPVSSEAVKETAGLVAVYNDEIIDARFFSTSAGITAGFNDVWHDRKTGAFPGPAVPYLVSRSQLRAGELPDLSREKQELAFFEDVSVNSFDSESPWFRWSVEMTREQLEVSITENLARQHKAQPGFILTRRGDEFVAAGIAPDPLGKLLDLNVIRRGAGGNIMELEITGQNGTYRLVKEFNIRFTLRPVNYLAGGGDVLLRRHDGSALKNYGLLPSTFLSLDISRGSDGSISAVRFLGGGNGHGVGMSQWGARGLAAEGRTYKDIILHYYPGSKLKRMY